MRPIYLKLAGLNSFQEQQEIDFEQLCQGGVFGIFGPTGSGKSTILDAITLALYGSVERAPNNTTGIMNHAVDRLSVSFTFELRNAIGTHRYVVERSYKRSDEQRLRSSMSRLVRLGEEDYVLADKDREVTAKVQEILGLTAEDFTRAVVLPQGKFAEFLTLGGSDRRRMLQRLFHLEKYGDRLTARIKQRRDELEAKTNVIRAEQAGLGDCSPEHIRAAEERLQEARQAAENLHSQREQIEKEHAENKEVWARQLEKQELERAYTALLEQDEANQHMEQKVELAHQAELLRPYLEELQHAEKEQTHWQSQRTESKHLYEREQQSYVENQRNYRTAREMLADKEPQLIARIESLRAAVELQEQTEQQEREHNDQVAARDQLIQQQQALQAEIEKEKLLIEKGKQLQAELQAKLEQKTFKAEERVRITQALQLKQKYDFIQKEMAVSAQEHQRRQEQLTTLQQQEVDVQKQLLTLHRTLAAEVDQLALLDQQVQALEVDAKQLEAHTMEAIKQQKLRLAEAQQQLLAHQLATQLHEGEPCPVCGSHDHPQPATGHEGLVPTDEQLLQLEALQHECRDILQEVKSLRFQIDQIGKQLETIPSAAQIMHSEIALSVADTPWQTNVDLDSSLVLKQRLTHTQEELQRLHKSLFAQMNGMNEWTQKQKEGHIRIVNAVEQVEASRQKQEQLQKSIDEVLLNWDEHYSDIELDRIEALHDEMDKRALEVETLQQRLQMGVTYMEEHEKLLQQLDAQSRQLQLLQAKLDAEIEAISELMLEKRERIQQITAGANVFSLLQSETDHLAQLKQREEQTRIALENSEQSLRTSESQYKAAEQALINATNRYELALHKWNTQLEQSRFQSQAEVLAAYMAQTELQSYRDHIQQYRDQKKEMELKITAVSAFLQGREVSAEQWEALQNKLLTVKAAHEEALQLRAKAERDVEELTIKHVRWQQLDIERIELEQQLERILKLQAVCRGNALVDFISSEQLMQISKDASSRLRNLTRGRYALEVDSSGGFVICDDANGGIRRPVSTLSGGETFLTSLALALSLSAQVQLQGQYPLEFFFLDEGFGSLDQELLDTVVTALEKLQSSTFTVGVISHVPELKERIARKIVVEAAATGSGSRVKMEMM